MFKTESFTTEEISIIQTRQLRKTIHFLYHRSPFYRDAMDRIGIDPADIKSLDDLTHIPAVGRLDLAREKDRFLCVRPEEVTDQWLILDQGNEPLMIKLTESDLARRAYASQLSFSCAGLTSEDVALLAMSLDGDQSAGLSAYLGFRRAGIRTFRMGGTDPVIFLECVRRFPITVIVARASMLIKLAVLAEEQKIDWPLPHVRLLIACQETIRMENFAWNETGTLLKKLWGIDVLFGDDNPELAAGLCECTAGRGLHLHPELMHAETIDSKGCPISNGRIGELCVTSFGISGMPFLRYKTGYFCTLKSEKCLCGRSAQRIGPWQGQIHESFYRDGQVVFFEPLLQIIQRESLVIDYRIEIEDQDELNSQVTLFIKTENNSIGVLLKDKIAQALNYIPKIVIHSRAEWKERLPWKGSRRIIDRRSAVQ